MKPTNEDFKPRRDGWFEHQATWGEVTVGTVIASQKRTERWEILAVAHGQQVEYGKTLWMRAREQVSGAEYSVNPRVKTSSVTILTQDPADWQTADPTAPTDTEAVQLVIAQLGAVHLATRDNVTGEIHCPDYDSGHTHVEEYGPGVLRRCELEHLALAHGYDVSTLRDSDIKAIVTVHGQAHDPQYPHVGKGGFPHRHVPEDLTRF